MNGNMTASDKMKKALISVMRTDPFFSTILLKMDFIEDSSFFPPTIQTNGKQLRFNPKFVDVCSNKVLDIILCHEAMHVAFGHHLRGKNRDQRLFNFAGDLAINTFLKDRDGFPEDGLLAWRMPFEEFTPEKNAEFYYGLLEQMAEKQEKKQKGKGGKGGKNTTQEKDEDTEGEVGGDGTSGTGSNQQGKDGGEQEEGSDRQAGKSSGKKTGRGKTSSNERRPKEQRTGRSGHSDRRDDGREEDDHGDDADNQRPPQESDLDEGSSEDSSMGEESGGRENHPNSIEDKGNLGTFEQYELQPGETMEQVRAEWEQTIAQAIVEAKEAGKMPGNLVERLDGLIGVAQVPWRLVLRPFLSKCMKNGWSYRRPNRRSIYRSDIILPSLMSRTLGEIMLVIDTSGSMDNYEMAKVLPEMDAILREFRKAELNVLQFDTRITWEKKFTSLDSPIKVKQWKWYGRGGTNFKCWIDRVRKDRPKACIVLTDGHPCDGWFTDPQVPTLFLMTTDVKAPWGFTFKLK